MNINVINKSLVSINKNLNYIPVASTVTNLINLFQKVIILPMMARKIIQNSYYYTYLDQESFFRLIILLIPGLGNIFIGIYDYKEKKETLIQVKQNGFALEHASARLRDDKDVVLAAIKQNGFALGHASARLQDDKDVVLAAIKQNGFALEHASEGLKDNKDFMLAAVKQKGWALIHASAGLRDDKDVVLAAVKQKGWALIHASARLRDDKDVVLAAVKQNGNALESASVEKLNNIRLIKIAFNQKICSGQKPSPWLQDKMKSL